MIILDGSSLFYFFLCSKIIFSLNVKDIVLERNNHKQKKMPNREKRWIFFKKKKIERNKLKIEPKMTLHFFSNEMMMLLLRINIEIFFSLATISTL